MLQKSKLDWDDLARAVVETVRAPLLVLDDEMKVLYANPAFLRDYDLDPAAFLHQPFLEFAGGQWDDPRLRELLASLLTERTEISDLELRLVLGERGPRVLVANARQLQLHGADRGLILLSLEDRTEREALHAAAELHLQRLERSNRDLEEFAHAASHDLQEPLRKVRTYAQRITESVPLEQLGDTHRKYFVRMSEAVERMQDRIDDMLRLGRLGRTPPVPVVVALGELVLDVVGDLETAIEQSAAEVIIDPLPELEGDPSQLRLLFQNLISNAIKFRREGVTPRIRIGTAEVDPSAPGTLGVTVQDNGIGFDPQYADRIFRPFERLHGREAYPGTGIGLSICRRIVENHHGRIVATSAPGEGALFTLNFPDSSSPRPR